MRPSGFVFRDSVTVEPYLGTGAFGDAYGPAVTVACRKEAVRQLVRNSDGQEVVSEATIYAAPEYEASFRNGSLVTIDGRTSTVLGISPQGRPGQTDLIRVTCS
jgi:hypothetical protein